MRRGMIRTVGVEENVPSRHLWGILGTLLLSAASLTAQDYEVGGFLSSETLNAPMTICANGSGETTINELLSSTDEYPRAVWIAFFASW